MPSIQDVADQINAKLDNISAKSNQTATNTKNTVTEVTEVQNKIAVTNSKLDQINFDLLNGFSNLGTGLEVIADLAKASLSVQLHQVKQADTIICLLENNNEMLCGITRKLTKQLEISERIALANERTEEILERVHSAEAADVDRHSQIAQQMEECCPPDEEPPEPCPDPCKKPDFRKPDLGRHDWQPLPAPQKPKPVG